MIGSPFASLSRTPKPRATVECGSYSNPNNGCTEEREDAIAAYTTALAWSLTGNAAYAQKSIALMDAWSATLRSHTNSNGPLQTGWAGSVWPRAETTRIQGADLYPELQDRLRHAYGFHTKIENGAAVPAGICGGTVKKGLGLVSEVAFNALHTRNGVAMANTQAYTEKKRPQGTNHLFVAWETLTHANNPS
jgi:hypothetical protein